jgi:hypothetical protein
MSTNPERLSLLLLKGEAEQSRGSCGNYFRGLIVVDCRICKAFLQFVAI